MYAALLVTTMVVLTAIALAIIKVSYLYVFGPYPVNHWYIDYAIDFFGIAVHVLLAMAVVAVFRRFVSAESATKPDERKHQGGKENERFLPQLLWKKPHTSFHACCGEYSRLDVFIHSKRRILSGYYSDPF